MIRSMYHAQSVKAVIIPKVLDPRPEHSLDAMKCRYLLNCPTFLSVVPSTADDGRITAAHVICDSKRAQEQHPSRLSSPSVPQGFSP